MVINNWSRSLDGNKKVDVFIMDPEKAFNTHPHELLKTKLNSYGISSQTLNWIHSFLCNRSQFLVVTGTKSAWLKLFLVLLVQFCSQCISMIGSEILPQRFNYLQMTVFVSIP